MKKKLFAFSCLFSFWTATSEGIESRFQNLKIEQKCFFLSFKVKIKSHRNFDIKIARKTFNLCKVQCENAMSLWLSANFAM